MFQSSANRLRVWLDRAGDILGDPPEAMDRDHEYHLTHPHRRDLRWERNRRPGMVRPRPAHCISPVRSAPDHAHRHLSERP
jgi:hypothetical protein